MKDLIEVNKLIEKLEDMKKRGTLLAGPFVTQEDVFTQIVGIIASVAMD